MLVLTRFYSIKSECLDQRIDCSLTYECPNHFIVRNVKSSWIKFSPTQSFGCQWQGQTVLMDPIVLVTLKKIKIRPPRQCYGNTTYCFIAYWMQSSILFCCTETNNILRAVSSREDAVFSIRTFTWSWCLPVSRLCRSSYGRSFSRLVFALTQD